MKHIHYAILHVGTAVQYVNIVHAQKKKNHKIESRRFDVTRSLRRTNMPFGGMNISFGGMNMPFRQKLWAEGRKAEREEHALPAEAGGERAEHAFPSEEPFANQTESKKRRPIRPRLDSTRLSTKSSERQNARWNEQTSGGLTTQKLFLFTGAIRENK